ncbi:MAG: insulinase family protein, partial [Caldilineaceae bacterium]|nr:insulinase family protein [Caldilineaceae bacterium]
MDAVSTYGFDLVRDEQIDELKTRSRLYRHVKTGAEVLSLENDDENKVFGISFRTPPADSTGIAHILEHAVLGGSQKYPLKEPFVQLLKGSLHTFLNAFTSPDKTTYPVASTNLQDFYNLVEVYLDAVFHPLITPHHLGQEGWHYELEAPDAPLTYRGVVFNEMKGVYSSPDSILGRAASQGLFPDNAYGLDSGGDPTVIPQLTYEQFVAFHKAYYNPSNAQIFFYGDDDPEQRLRILAEVLD